MIKITKILFLTIMGSLWGAIYPENGATFNYTQLFFQWNQIPNAEEYSITIQKIGTMDIMEYTTSQNSILLLDEFEWGTYYNWSVCSYNSVGEQIQCNDEYSFSINELPEYFPNTDNLAINEDIYQEGITVMDFESLNFSGGIEKYGNPVWFVDKDLFDIRFTFTEFLQNGNVIGFEPGSGYEIDLNGNIIFQTPDGIDLHHDFFKTSNNTYFLISAIIENNYCPEECNPSLPDEIPWQGDIFKEFDQYGNEIWSWNSFDYIDSSEYNPYYVQVYNGNDEMDWTHSNSVFFDENSQSVFISIRNLSRVTKIDYLSKEIDWNLGQTDFMNEIYYDVDLNFSQQHSVQVLDNGNLLFFDNHRYLNPELSRCIEVEYDEVNHIAYIVWEYELTAETSSGSRGECDRLENGNTLITAGRSGHILEVTPSQEISWHLEFDNSQVFTSSYRSERIPNLHPIAYSITLANLMGEVDNSYVAPINDILDATIHNNSWGTGWFNYTLLNNDVELTSNNFFVNAYENTNLNIDLSNLNISVGSLLTLKVFSEHAPDKLQEVEFRVYSSLLLGDLNSDGAFNILDIVLLAGLILDDDSSNPAGDVNSDGSQDILDIILIINFILDEN